MEHYQNGAQRRRVIVAMKGHPGTGKSTLAHRIATALKCPLLDKDDFRDSTWAFQQTLLLHSSTPGSDSTILKLLNDLSYEVLWRTAKTQLGLGLSVVIDSPLSRKAHLDRLLELVRSCEGSLLVIVECKPKNEAEWRRRLEERGAANGASWHKPATWEDMERLLQGYGGCSEYDAGEVPRRVLDTTAAGVGVDELVESVMEFIDASFGYHHHSNTILRNPSQNGKESSCLEMNQMLMV